MPNHHSGVQPGPGGMRHGGPGRHTLLMIACCIPIVALAVLLVATGAAGPGVFLVALACLVMMGAMMFMMGRGSS